MEIILLPVSRISTIIPEIIEVLVEIPNVLFFTNLILVASLFVLLPLFLNRVCLRMPHPMKKLWFDFFYGFTDFKPIGFWHGQIQNKKVRLNSIHLIPASKPSEAACIFVKIPLSIGFKYFFRLISSITIKFFMLIPELLKYRY